MTMTPAPSHEAPPSLQLHWISAGAASALTRFIPLPFVDSIIDTQAKHYAVYRTLEHHRTAFAASDVAVLYEGEGGRMDKLVGALAKLPVKLLLYPIRKLVRIFNAAHGMPTDMAETYLLGRAVDRALRLGVLDAARVGPELHDRALRVRKAYERALSAVSDEFRAALEERAKAEFGRATSRIHQTVQDIFDQAEPAPPSSQERDELADDDPALSDDERAHRRAAAEAMEHLSFLLEDFDDRLARAFDDRGVNQADVGAVSDDAPRGSVSHLRAVS